MRRTQMYLGERDAALLDTVARKTGKTRSRLIREAVEATYGAAPHPAALERAIRESFGAWRRRGRLDGAAYVERLRRGRLAELHG